LSNIHRTIVALAASITLAACSADDSNSGTTPPPDGTDDPTAYPVADATVEGPITGGLYGHALWDSWYDLSELGYVEEEFFLSGVAKVQPDGAEAPYTTRIIVRRPTDAANFSGTVMLDWTNVTAQFENAVDTLEAHSFLQREGWAYVHVSAQAAGVCCVPQLTPKIWDPTRYGALNHPGDDWSYDMFAQIAKAIRAPIGIDPMGGLPVETVIAAGQSQSASRLYGYVNEGYARSRVIDGFLIHGGGDKTFDEPLPVPVIHLLSDNEASLDPPTADPNFALWELAGSSHTDMFVGLHQVLGQGPRQELHLPQRPASADEDLHAMIANYGEQPSPYFVACVVAGSAFPVRYAVNASLDHLDRWSRTGVPAPSGPRFAMNASGGLLRDGFGNTLGGIRYPVVEAPIARYQSTACPLGGITVPFTELQIATEYASHADYYCQLKASADRNVAEGFILAEDRDELLARADAAANRFLVAGAKDCE
jgi:hypothetical protein